MDVKGLVVSVDRCERGTGEKSAIDELQDQFGIKIRAIVTMKEVIEHLYGREVNGRVVIDDEIMAAIDEYYRRYGVR